MSDNGFFKRAVAREHVSDVKHGVVLKTEQNIGVSEPYIRVDDEHALFRFGEFYGEIDAHGRFSCAAFARNEQKDFSHRRPFLSVILLSYYII